MIALFSKKITGKTFQETLTSERKATNCSPGVFVEVLHKSNKWVGNLVANIKEFKLTRIVFGTLKQARVSRLFRKKVRRNSFCRQPKIDKLKIGVILFCPAKLSVFLGLVLSTKVYNLIRTVKEFRFQNLLAKKVIEKLRHSNKINYSIDLEFSVLLVQT